MSIPRAQIDSYPTSPTIYFEGSDGSGKDAIADLIVQTHEERGERFTKSGAFFLPETNATFADWKDAYDRKTLEPAMLLAAAAMDAGLAADRQHDMPHVQASHYGIRSAAFQQAFEYDLYEEFDTVAQLLPGRAVPIALETSIPELQRRIEANPESNNFDRLVFREPERIRRLGVYIGEKCVRAGGFIIETTGRPVEEIAEEAEERIAAVNLPLNVFDPQYVRSTGEEVLRDLRSNARYPGVEPIVDHVLQRFDELRS